ncbi:hypothetical protein [Siccirubricoccus phaeus]|uniref:hypothetical protein n=1 Tax=Siccirubricoccus phaeus TaxID=2595053 RepID=UPI0011F0DDDE|nr:hypothetical protein [Siccirubricoccus phaeus]
MAAALPAAAYEVVTPAQHLTGQPGRAILPDSAAKLRLDSPGRSWWALGEAMPVAPAEAGEGTSYRASVALGSRHELMVLPSVSWAVLPELRVDAAGGPHGAAAIPAFGASLLQEAAVSLPGGSRFRASIGLGDSVGVPELLTDGRGAADNLAVRASASLASDVGSVVGTPLRAELQLATVRKVLSHGWTELSSSCELKLELSRPSLAPLRIAGACPGAAAPKLTIGISGRF